MSAILKASVVFLVNSTEIDLCLPLIIKTDEQALKKEALPEAGNKPLSSLPSPAESLIKRISQIQNNKITTPHN
jgi:hypothetical protein